MDQREMEAWLDDMEQRIKGMRQIIRREPQNGNWPSIRPTPPQPPPPPPVIGLRTGCNTCGLFGDGPMGYVCFRADCPSAVRCVA